MTNSNHRVFKYIKRDMARVQGWLNPLSAEVIAAIGVDQAARGVVGAVGEIGVHHGKLWLILDHVASETEPRFAIDVFDMQELNTDNSGEGDENAFARNREKYGAGAGDAHILKASSLDVSAGDLLAKAGPARLFSIDGGHTPECTLNDLELAASVICDEGVVALDDVFNPRFPGVMTGLFQYRHSGDCALAPFAITPGKVLMSRPAHVDAYKRFVCESFPEEVLSMNSFMGRETPTLMRNINIARKGKKIIGGTVLEPLARRAYMAFLR
jgi:hypothetical protein